MPPDPFGVNGKWTELKETLEAQTALLRQIAQSEDGHGAVRPTELIPRHQTASFGPATVEWHQLIAPQPTVIGVVALLAVAAGTVVVTFGQGQSASDATAFPSVQRVGGGALPLVANSVLQWATSYPSLLLTTSQPGMGIFVHLSTEVQVDGYLTYVLIDYPSPAA